MKKELGQFYTTNSDYIVGNLLDVFPHNATIVDMFAGNWDLLNLVKDTHSVIGYDIDVKNNYTVQQDSFNCITNYKGKWIITNPPYLAKNKNKNKDVYNKYDTDDLYKAAIKVIDGCEGGVIIIPVNFFCSEDSEIRKLFLSKYKVVKLNIFEERVFSDTDYTVCAFSFIKNNAGTKKLDCTFFPSKDKQTFDIGNNNYRIGNEFFELLDNVKKVNVSRLLQGEKPNSDILLRAIDTGTDKGRIKLEIEKNHHYGIKTDRNIATIIMPKKLNSSDEEKIVNKFNSTLEGFRKKYRSLFLTNYRNSTKSYARKRISFDVAYRLIQHIYNNDIETQSQ